MLSSDPRLKSLALRRIANVGKQVDNAALPAGSPMYYYCRSCGASTAILPEDWVKTPPPRYCLECRPLVDHGIITDNYDDWLIARGKEPVPR